MTWDDFTALARRMSHGLGPTSLAIPVTLGVFLGGSLVAAFRLMMPDHVAPDWAITCGGVAVLKRLILPTIVSLIPGLGELFGIVDLLCFFVREDRRSLRDLMAGTIVIDG